MESQVISQNLSKKEKIEGYAEFLTEETLRRLITLESLEAVVLATAYGVGYTNLKMMFQRWLESLEEAKEQLQEED